MTALVHRCYLVSDVTIRSDGSGRTVEAYAAVFGTPAEIHDLDGHYHEVLSPSSFNKTIADNGTRFGVFYNHARTIAGTPDGSLSIPIGVPVDVHADARGVFTATEYLDNPIADSVLDGIKRGAIRGQSFSGRFVSSQRTRAKRGEALDTITRNEVAMREYGPTVFPAYVEAAILGTRSGSEFLDMLQSARDEDPARFHELLGLITSPLARAEPVESVGTPGNGAAETPGEPSEHSPVLDTPDMRRAHIARLANPRKATK